jgi:hypothetical protein
MLLRCGFSRNWLNANSWELMNLQNEAPKVKSLSSDLVGNRFVWKVSIVTASASSQ